MELSPEERSTKKRRHELRQSSDKGWPQGVQQLVWYQMLLDCHDCCERSPGLCPFPLAGKG